MRHTVIAKAVLVLGLSLIGCDDKSGTSPEKTVGSTPAVASTTVPAAPKKPVVTEPELPADAPKVELLTAGADPKRELRYSFNEGETEDWVMKQRTNVNIEGAKQPPGNMPAMKVTFQVHTDKVERNGVGHFRFSYSEAEFVDSDLPDALRRKMNESLLQISKVKGTQVITNRGFVLRSSFDAAGIEDPKLKAIVDSMSKSINQLSSPLPEEAVGVGATWKVAHDVEMMGMQLKQSANYEVVSMDGNKVELKVSVKQDAGDNKLALPGMPGAARVELKKLDGKGSGTATLHPATLLPTSDLDFNTQIVTREANGPEVAIKMNITVSIAPAD